MTEITPELAPETALQVQPRPLTREQIDILKDTAAKGATDEELRFYIQVCNRLRLDPFARQIHMVKRWDDQLKRYVMAIQVGIDGFRARAEATRKYKGQLPMMWCGMDGKWVDVWLDQKPPAAAKATVLRAGFREPVTAVALYTEYVQKTREGFPNSMWKKMPAGQLAKCAEALALRKAFPDELSGLYTNEEMGQADNEPEPRLRQITPSAAAVNVEPAADLPSEPIDQTTQPLSPESVLDQILANFSRDPKVIDPTFAELRENWKTVLQEDVLDQILLEHGLGPGEARMVGKAKHAFRAAWTTYNQALAEREEEKARDAEEEKTE